MQCTIALPTSSARAVWTEEIVGQLSDGMWENTSPHDHWKFWNGLKVAEGEPCVTSNTCPRKNNYGLTRLIPIIGDRMVAIGRMGKVDGVDEAMLHAAEYMPDTLEEWEKAKASGEWEYDFVKDYMAYVPQWIAAKFYETAYTEKDLRADLKLIKKAMKSIDTW